MNVSIRPALAPDLEAILAIAAASPEAPRWKPADYAAFFVPEPQLSPGPLLRNAFLAAAGNAPLGFAAASLLLDGEENRAELDSIAVLPAARRLGIGSSLLQAVLSWAARHGARHLALEVRASSTPAVRLYESTGLKPEGRRPRYYADPEEDALLMGMDVTSVPLPPSFFHRESR